jgi:hypothetical protein
MRGEVRERRGFPSAIRSGAGGGRLRRPVETSGGRKAGALDGARVEGELWEIDDRPGALDVLDDYEDVEQGLFVRRRVFAHRDGAAAVRAWAYLDPHQR